MSDYLTHGAKVISGGKRSGTKAPARRGRGRQAKADDPAVIREWAKNNGYLVNERGRISAEVVRAYDELH
jgi:Lsr2